MQSKSKRSYGSGSVAVKGNSYIGRWYVNGRRIKRSLGPVKSKACPGGLTKKEAEAKLRELMASVTAPASSTIPIFREAAAQHVSRLELLGRKPTTIKDYRGTLEIQLNPEFGDRRVDKITKQEIEAWVARKLRAKSAFTKKPISPKSICNWLSLLHAVLTYCEKQEWIEKNPARLVDRPKQIESDQEFKFLTQGELEQLLGEVPVADEDGKPDPLGLMERTMYRTAAMTSLRQGEIRALRWSDIDWLGEKIRVRSAMVLEKVGKPKSGTSIRSVPLAPSVAKELEDHYQRSAWKADEDFVFCHPFTGKPYDRSKLLKRFKDARDRAEVTKVPFHGLRHTFGTRMAMAGVPLRQIQEWMGHSDAKTTERYAHYAPGKDEAELIERAFATEGPNQGPNLSESVGDSAQS